MTRRCTITLICFAQILIHHIFLNVNIEGHGLFNAEKSCFARTAAVVSVKHFKD